MSDTLAEPTEEMAFLALHKKFIGAQNPNSAMLHLHEAALDRFETLGFPHSKHEMYTFVNTKNLVATPFAISNTTSIPEEVIASHIFSGCENSCLVFVNGVYNPSLSKLQAIGSSVKISSMSEKDDLDQVIASLENENDVFACLANAFCTDAMVVEISDKTQVSAPIQVLFISTGDTSAPDMHSSRLILSLIHI